MSGTTARRVVEYGGTVIFGDSNPGLSGRTQSTGGIGCIGSQRYVRMTSTPPNNTPEALLTAVAALGNPMPD